MPSAVRPLVVGRLCRSLAHSSLLQDLKQIDKKIKDLFYSREMRTKFEEARKANALAAKAAKKKPAGHPEDHKSK